MRLAPILHHIVARASVARIWYKLPLTVKSMWSSRVKNSSSNGDVHESSRLSSFFLHMPSSVVRLASAAVYHHQPPVHLLRRVPSSVELNES
ncbi:hypothetical protein Y032_0235g3164 [Ancylostoma ceylanicum]|nr:hypothetical protein Y032_0235g3164 [Ancylostoma ceylanicum]